MGAAASWDVPSGCLVHNLGKVVIILGVHWEMGNLPFKVLLEARPVRFPKVESPLERDRGRGDCSIDCQANGAVLGFWQWLEYQLFAQSYDVLADKHNIRVITGY